MPDTSEYRAWLERRDLLKDRLEDPDLTSDDVADLEAELRSIEAILAQIEDQIGRLTF